MSRVFLLRHAKAVWPTTGQKDFDRTLDKDGIDAARMLGETMRRMELIPDVILCSPAIRARQTLEHVDITPRLAHQEAEKLYSGGPDAYLLAVRMTGLEFDQAQSVMLVGHNPMMEEMATALAGRGDPPTHPSFVPGFPTAGLAVIEFDAPLQDVRPGHGILREFLSPSEHL
ncbi:histidine phosphatase family protein [Phyllobacterium sp. 21LDTY02-6]|uniref:SixA phosphatase family protein n=1 Tax=Phyllobacterium sp. 21LDTY02-6 TaxID=2944903 RepID=UPI002021E731|nr:histidine phosphatase family protein [Phyllobacterium sp. 21LDTY02-6]MCO4316210.1 histidine phosphatase family protein [Phyllobacterium sp. 21LDTY02-6]